MWNIVLQVGSHESRVQGENHLPQPAGHTFSDVAKGTAGFMGCEHTLMRHIELFVALETFPTIPVFCNRS